MNDVQKQPEMDLLDSKKEGSKQFDSEIDHDMINKVVSKTAEKMLQGQLAVKDKDKELTAYFASQYSIPQDQLLPTVKEMCFPSRKDNDGKRVQTATTAQLMVFMSVAKKYDLNPFIKEIYAFPTDGGGINPIVSVDGWNSLVLRHPKYIRKEFKYSDEMVDAEINPSTKKPMHKKAHEWVECTIYTLGNDGKEHAETYREYFDEVYREPFIKGNYIKNGPWQTHTKRMHRHKAFIQAARAALGLSGIYDADEGERIQDAVDVKPVENVHTDMWVNKTNIASDDVIDIEMEVDQDE